MSTTHYALWLRWQRRDAFLIWQTGAADGVRVDASGHVPMFSSIDELERQAQTSGIALSTGELVLHDLDRLAAWLLAPESAIDATCLLTAWNLFGDIARSTGRVFDAAPNASAALYEKLFFGSDAANRVLKPAAEPVQTPPWSADERERLRHLLHAGLDLFGDVCRRAADSEVEPELDRDASRSSPVASPPTPKALP